jgi:hypothetical protein
VPGRVLAGRRRRLHTDDDEILFDAVRPILLTSVSDVIARSDLADRAILIELPRIPEEQRRPEADFNAAFEATRLRLLGALLDAMVTGLRRCSAVTLANYPGLPTSPSGRPPVKVVVSAGEKARKDDGERVDVAVYFLR